MAASMAGKILLKNATKCAFLHQGTGIASPAITHILTHVRTSMYNPKYLEPTIDKESLSKPIPDDDQRKYRPIKAARNEQTTLFHHDPLIEKFIGMVMEDGKRKLARELIDKAFKQVKRIQIEKYHKSSEEERENIVLDPVTIFHQAYKNCEPVLELTKVVKGGIAYQVPIPCRPQRQQFLAMRWLIASSNEKDRNTRFYDKLAWELIEASKGQGASVRKKQELHRVCEANRAYAHFRPQGYLFEKEAILEYIIHQKREIVRKLKEYDKQKMLMESKQKEEAHAAHESKIKAFVEKESSIISRPINPFKSKPKADDADDTVVPTTSAAAASSDGSGSISNMKDDKKKDLPSFWLPSLTPQAEEDVIKKPDETVRCPMSGKPLKMKDLIPVNFTPIKDRDSKTSIHVKTSRYVCPVSNDVISNSTPCVVLRPSGSVITEDCYEKLIKKDGLDPLNGAKLGDKDVIRLQRGATGFSGSGLELKAKKEGASLMAA